MTTSVVRPAGVGQRVTWRLITRPSRAMAHGRVLSITAQARAVGAAERPSEGLEYHILGDDGVTYVVAAEFVRPEDPHWQERIVTVNPLDRKRCQHCGAYLQSGLQNTIHPHHTKSCELYPDNAWRGYKLVKVEEQ